MGADSVRSKAQCCKDRPRCKRCPVVCRRLAQAGFLERQDRRTWSVVEPVPKRVLDAARA